MATQPGARVSASAATRIYRTVVLSATSDHSPQSGGTDIGWAVRSGSDTQGHAAVMPGAADGVITTWRTTLRLRAGAGAQIQIFGAGSVADQPGPTYTCTITIDGHAVAHETLASGDNVRGAVASCAADVR